jgi:hypothetical protein
VIDTSVVNLGSEWMWLRMNYVDMLQAVQKTQMDDRERGFFIIQNENMFPVRTKVQVGNGARVVLKMKSLSALLTAQSRLVSFHTHCFASGRPSRTDGDTALALGEEYTVIGYPGGVSRKCLTVLSIPHIVVWKITEGKYRYSKQLVFKF